MMVTFCVRMCLWDAFGERNALCLCDEYGERDVSACACGMVSIVNMMRHCIGLGADCFGRSISREGVVW